MTDAKPVRRRPRVDASRNRDRLIAIAKAMFAEGVLEVRLDEVARRASLGIGTLYRHFPNRDALTEAIYRTEVEALGKAATQLSASRQPIEALRDWMHLFVDYIATKQLIAPALNAMVGGPDRVYEGSGKIIKSAIADLVGRAVAEGQIRADLEPLDLLRALVGVANVASAPDWAASARRLVDILIAGSRSNA